MATQSTPTSSNDHPPTRRIRSGNLKLLLTAIGDPVRWHILSELLKGEALPIKEIGLRIGLPMTNTSKHIQHLFKAGIVERRYNRAYQIQAHFITPGSQVLRIGPISVDLAGVDFK